MTTWDDVETLAIWLECQPGEVTRLRNENCSLRGITYKVLASFYHRNAIIDANTWNKIKEVLSVLNKNTTVVDSGIEQLHHQAISKSQINTEGQGYNFSSGRLQPLEFNRIDSVCSKLNHY